MIIWITAAVIGAIFSLIGFILLYGKFRRGEITRIYLAAFVLGFISFASYALISALKPDIMTSLLTLLLLLPAIIAIVVLVREHKHATTTGDSENKA